MLKRVVKYEDFNGDKVEEALFFHLSGDEIVTLNRKYEGGLSAYIKSAVSSADVNKIYEMVKTLILESYGVKSADGRRFTKNDTIREDFASSIAFDTLLFEILGDETGNEASAFIEGIVPKNVATEMKNNMESGKIREELEGLI